MLSNTQLWKDFSRKSSQRCSTELSSGEYGGKNKSCKLLGKGTDWFLCHPAPSSTIKIFFCECRSLTSCRNISMHEPFTQGSTKYRACHREAKRWHRHRCILGDHCFCHGAHGLGTPAVTGIGDPAKTGLVLEHQH
ncbi:hypothetical protein EDC63_11922 [Sulfurirhabdus autotrophica]|uniref:Uncharacterized protein n=1 Tax=Sulfurirhabdus autotrophica TaxID=1706046 RepID=A0A4R3XSS1_9PROT|nr:hypothetical protein EDC63_11922 [Sulfurirhabdus autotrophica]